MDIFECIKQRRSIRLFKDRPIDRNDLCELTDLARRSPSAGNRQPLEYIIVDEKSLVGRVYDQLAWAAYVTPRRTPPAGKRPAAYIIVLLDRNRSLSAYADADAGAAIQTILLAACAKGLGTCWIGSVQRDPIRQLFSIPETLDIHSVIALGYPDEEPVMEDMESKELEAVKYYLDADNRLHVPKRTTTSILHINAF